MDNDSLTYALMNASSDLAVIINLNGLILEINDAALRRFDLERDKIINHSLFSLLPSDYINFRKVYIDIVLQSYEPHRFEDEFNGLSYHACIYPLINNKTNNIDKLAIFATDKTIFKKNEDLYIKHSKILSTVQSPMAFINIDLTVQIVNDVYCKYFEKNEEEIYGESIEKLYGKETYEIKLKEQIDNCLKGNTSSSQHWFTFPDGIERYMLMNFYPFFKNSNTVSGIVINSTDITKMKQMEDELKKLSITDQLTGIYNRVKFAEALTDEINRLKRYNSGLSIIMFDIDHFKNVNDIFGHDVGDEVLKKLSNLVNEYIRDTDIFSRWGGEEFMILLPHTKITDASNLANRIREKIENKYFKGPNTVTCSFGVTEYTIDDTEESYTKRVDEALYKSKHSGRNMVTVL